MNGIETHPTRTHTSKKQKEKSKHCCYCVFKLTMILSRVFWVSKDIEQRFGRTWEFENKILRKEKKTQSSRGREERIYAFEKQQKEWTEREREREREREHSKSKMWQQNHPHIAKSAI